MHYFVLLLSVVFITAGLSPLEARNSDEFRVKLPQLGQPDLSGELGKEILYLFHRQLGADCRDRLVFGERSYLKEIFTKAEPGKRMREHQIRPYTSLVFASAAALTFGEYNQAATGIGRQELAKITVSLARELSAHHIANCDKSSWWWGDEWQSAHWAAALAKGAWLIWDRLPQDTRRNVVNMVIFEADRFIDVPAPFNEFDDTKAEENSWNANILVIAYCMLPDHPHRAVWGEKAIEYMVTSYAAPQDVTSSQVIDGKPLNQWLRGPNMHADYTLENHGFFHPDYITASSQNVLNLTIYRLAGEKAPESALFNIQHCRELVSFLTLPNGWTFYPQSTDWSNYRHDVTLMAQMANSVMPDAAGAMCMRWGLDFLKYVDSLQEGKTSENLFRGINFNCCPLQTLTDLYLLHYLFGPGAEPLSDQQARKQLCGTRLFEYGKCVITRSEKSIASFSWFNTDKRLMAVVTPLTPDGFCLPKFRSLIGTVDGKVDNINVVKREVKMLDGGGFCAGIVCERGPEMSLKERVMMVALPDGRTIYAEWFDSTSAKTEELRTGVLFWDKNSFWHRGVEPVVYHPGGKWTAKDGSVVLDGVRTAWVNLGGRMGVALYGSNSVLVEEGEMSLNYSKSTVPARMVAVFLPSASVQETAKHAERIRVESSSDGLTVVNLGDMQVVLNADECTCVVR